MVFLKSLLLNDNSIIWGWKMID